MSSADEVVGLPGVSWSIEELGAEGEVGSGVTLAAGGVALTRGGATGGAVLETGGGTTAVTGGMMGGATGGTIGDSLGDTTDGTIGVTVDGSTGTAMDGTTGGAVGGTVGVAMLVRDSREGDLGGRGCVGSLAVVSRERDVEGFGRGVVELVVSLLEEVEWSEVTTEGGTVTGAGDGE